MKKALFYLDCFGIPRTFLESNEEYQEKEGIKMKEKKINKLDRRLLEILYDGFVKCPTTGKILEVMKGDDKVLCGCGKSNPKCQAEQTERTNTHLVSFCERTSVDEFIAQGYAWRSKES